MSDGSAKPVIFISYSHKDEPEHDPDGDIYWLRDILSYVAPATNGVYELWTDEDIDGGADWEKEIKIRLAACDICILLVSRHSLASKFIIKVEIETILKRQQRGDAVQLYPIVLSPFPPAAAPASLLALNLRPRLDRPLSGFSRHDRGTAMSEIAEEIVGILRSKIAVAVTERAKPFQSPAFAHITGLPETGYERLQGREPELSRLDDAWADRNIKIISLIAEGGAGKSALVNEWLKRLQVKNYSGAETLLGWSFYNQGTKERTTSADEFLNWALDKLNIKIETTSAGAKGEAIAEAMMKRRILLVLDGCEPLQHGPGSQTSQLKDLGLRALLRRFAAGSSVNACGLIVLTSRLAIKDIMRWRDTTAPVVPLDKLSCEAGAALLRDNGVWGTNAQLRSASRDFGGHPLALGLLASFLNETQLGDVRRRDHIRGILADIENPGHDHAKRIMESYEKEWLESQPILLALMYMIGLFDRPASWTCLQALRNKPAIEGFTDSLVKLSDSEWSRAVARLRGVHLLAPRDLAAPYSIDAHPLVREWFGDRLAETNERAWRAAHARLYEHLRDTTREGKEPSLEELGPLYQAIMHGCRAGLQDQVLRRIYVDRICRKFSDGRTENYASQKLGALGSNLAAISWFFERPYEMPVAKLGTRRPWVLSQAAFALRAQGRFEEAIEALRAALQLSIPVEAWRNAAIYATILSETEMLIGDIAAAVRTAGQSIKYADAAIGAKKQPVEQSDAKGYDYRRIVSQITYAVALDAAGRREEAERQFADAESRQKERQPEYPLIYSLLGYYYSDLLLAQCKWVAARDRIKLTVEWADRYGNLLVRALERLLFGQVHLGLALEGIDLQESVSQVRETTFGIRNSFDQAVDGLRTAGQSGYIPRGLLARAAFRRSFGNWAGAAHDLDDVKEITELGPMKLYLCDLALARVRLAFARIEAFSPLNGLIDDSPPKPAALDAAETDSLKEEAAKQLAIAADYIKTCDYHRRDEELAELQAVLRGERKFADLPPRV